MKPRFRVLSRILLVLALVALGVAVVGLGLWVVGSGDPAGPDEVSGLARLRTTAGNALVVAVLAGTAWAWLRGFRRSTPKQRGSASR